MIKKSKANKWLSISIISICFYLFNTNLVFGQIHIDTTNYDSYPAAVIPQSNMPEEVVPENIFPEENTQENNIPEEVLPEIKPTEEIINEEPTPEIEIIEDHILTDRNYPLISNEFVFVQNRKLTDKSQIFIKPYKPKVTSTNKPYDIQTDEDKRYIIFEAWNTLDMNLFNKVIEIVKKDTSKFIRIQGIQCLSQYNTNESKDELKNLLKEKGAIGMVSALSLAQLDEFKVAINYISKNHSDAAALLYFSEINKALMNIGNDEAIKLLEIRAEDSKPSYALDAIAALSLLGKSDYAFKKFKEYSVYNHPTIRNNVIHCLAFYIATPEAMDIIIQMQNDEDWVVKHEANRIIEKYNLNRK